MKKKLTILAASTLLLWGCNKQYSPSKTSNINSKPSIESVKEILINEGFSTFNLIDADSGYIVEGDIFIPYTHFTNQNSNSPSVSEVEGNTPSTNKNKYLIGEIEQYRTFNIVTSYSMPGVSSGRKIYIKVATNLPTAFLTATDSAIARYNALNLAFQFVRITSSSTPDINITSNSLPAGVFASSGFPTSSGDPYNSIKMNVTYLGNSPNIGFLTTTIAHELGHCIGLRHTDYFDRRYSCGYTSTTPINEGDETNAIQIPGTTPTGDPNSFMLACSSVGTNRPFTSNDKTALLYLYGQFGAGDDGQFYQDSITGGLYQMMERKPRKIFSGSINTLYGGITNLNIRYAPIELPIGSNILDGSAVLKSNTSGTLYFLDRSSSGTTKKRLITSTIILNKYYFNTSYIQTVSDSVINSYQTGSSLPTTGNNGKFVRDGATGAVYVAMDDSLRKLNSINVIYNTFIMNSDHIPNILSLINKGTDILTGSRLIKTSTSDDVYFLDVHKDINGSTISEKRHIYNMEIFDRYRFKINQIQTVTQATLDSYSTGEPLN
ncbi:Dual-action HEIGH metallo-peptidase [Arachidicoccus rhizosphaerae]|uniref:Dual-action HEIGH metallo-peptidase n=1 Tax=Arachidicoccus rhizosphaerae TaxID=551991 RepID=A0A1H4D691_9BACT|nr:M57 family metalloprotease [Arachidicoccus rhizosphaerae]SEA68353.1 Dual-action HEIGH metallo-peptidase [Arachidicoccus rhizosphaerae]